MKNTGFESYLIDGLPREVQVRRMRRIIRQELTELQREALVGVYFENKTLTEIAKARSVNKSTVCRTLRRAEAKLRKYMT